MFNLKKLSIVATMLLSALSMINPAFAEMAKHVTEVDDGVYAYGDPAGGYTSMFVVTSDGVIVIEPINTTHSTTMLSAIRSDTDQPDR